MNHRALLTAILFGSAIAGTRLVAQTPAAPAELSADSAQCAAAAQDQVKAQARKRAMFGFARSLAGNLPMIGHSAGAAVAGQATAAALDVAASASATQTPRCSG